MAELLIILRRDPNTGKQNIVVKLDSDPDALPIEHEQLHRSIVEKLVGKGCTPRTWARSSSSARGPPRPASRRRRPGEQGREKAGQGN